MAKAGSTYRRVSSSQSVLVIGDFRGVLCLVGYFAALALVLRAVPTQWPGPESPWLGRRGVGGFITLLALWLLITALNGSSGMAGFGASFQISVGFGAILNLLAARR